MQKFASDSLIEFDRSHCSGNCRNLAGVDEAGRGPLAGPVVAAAVIFSKPADLPYLNDSKKLTEKRREALYERILESAWVGIGFASEAEIDEINIYQATILAMKRALDKLSRQQAPDLILVDGNMNLSLCAPSRSIVKGDQKSACIAAASIVAKVYRDAWMTEAETLYPGYGFSGHKGYGTKTHIEALRQKGPCPIHRKTFAPVREIYEARSTVV